MALTQVAVVPHAYDVCFGWTVFLCHASLCVCTCINCFHDLALIFLIEACDILYWPDWLYLHHVYHVQRCFCNLTVTAQRVRLGQPIHFALFPVFHLIPQTGNLC